MAGQNEEWSSFLNNSSTNYEPNLNRDGNMCDNIDEFNGKSKIISK